MITTYLNGLSPEKSLELFDQQTAAARQLVAEALTRGGDVTLHTHHELDFLPYVSGEFRYTGWTMGVTVGKFPRRSG